MDEWVVVSIDEVRIDLPHGHLLEASGDDVLIGEVILHNDQCFIGCLFGNQPGSDVCIGTDAEGNVLCQSVGDTDVEACEAFTEACAGMSGG